MSNTASRPERDLQAGLQIEERNCAVLVLCTNNAVRLQAEAVAVETNCPLQTVNAKRDQGYSRLHTPIVRET